MNLYVSTGTYILKGFSTKGLNCRLIAEGKWKEKFHCEAHKEGKERILNPNIQPEVLPLLSHVNSLPISIAHCSKHVALMIFCTRISLSLLLKRLFNYVRFFHISAKVEKQSKTCERLNLFLFLLKFWSKWTCVLVFFKKETKPFWTTALWTVITKDTQKPSGFLILKIRVK